MRAVVAEDDPYRSTTSRRWILLGLLALAALCVVWALSSHVGSPHETRDAEEHDTGSDDPLRPSTDEVTALREPIDAAAQTDDERNRPELPEQLTLLGTILFDDGDPAPDYMLRVRDYESDVPTQWQSAITAGDGTFALPLEANDFGTHAWYTVHDQGAVGQRVSYGTLPLVGQSVIRIPRPDDSDWRIEGRITVSGIVSLEEGMLWLASKAINRGFAYGSFAKADTELTVHSVIEPLSSIKGNILLIITVGQGDPLYRKTFGSIEQVRHVLETGLRVDAYQASITLPPIRRGILPERVVVSATQGIPGIPEEKELRVSPTGLAAPIPLTSGIYALEAHSDTNGLEASSTVTIGESDGTYRAENWAWVYPGPESQHIRVMLPEDVETSTRITAHAYLVGLSDDEEGGFSATGVSRFPWEEGDSIVELDLAGIHPGLYRIFLDGEGVAKKVLEAYLPTAPLHVFLEKQHDITVRPRSSGVATGPFEVIYRAEDTGVWERQMHDTNGPIVIEELGSGKHDLVVYCNEMIGVAETYPALNPVAQVALRSCEAISGTVRGSDGNPIPGVLVQLVRDKGYFDFPLLGIEQSVTDVAGQFRLLYGGIGPRTVRVMDRNGEKLMEVSDWESPLNIQIRD